MISYNKLNHAQGDVIVVDDDIIVEDLEKDEDNKKVEDYKKVVDVVKIYDDSLESVEDNIVELAKY
uniref:Uncharacterized protein n=1 Tax=Medicago truncatula TaxID=3880 RepID=A2Q2Y1_MEDTR|nr:hypothetical protein MtrDRAFT_AC152185g36v2 [Medicago truncatula]